MLLGREKGIFGKFVAVVGLIQSLGWLILCITCIVFSYHPPNVPSEPTSYNQYVSKAISENFFSDSDASNTRIIRPKEFQAFMWIYLIASAILMAASVDLLSAIRTNKARQVHVSFLLGVLILMISIVDLIFLAFLARDLGQCSFKYDSTLEDNGVSCNLATGIVMTIAARGYVLWAINVVLGVGMIIAAAEVFTSRTPKILYYDNNTIPRVQLGKSDTPIGSSPVGKENPFFRGGLNPSLSQTRPVTPNRNSSTPAVLTGRNNSNLYF